LLIVTIFSTIILVSCSSENMDYTITSGSFGGRSHSAALTETGRLFTWGANDFGQLGDGTTINRNKPKEITNKFNILPEETLDSIVLGYYHSAAVTSTGRVFTWGRNTLGELGDGSKVDRNIPKDISESFNLKPEEKIMSIALGWYTSSAITSVGRIFTWGSSNHGQLGNGSINSSADKPLDITEYFALTSNGMLFTWGSNTYGQLGFQSNSEIRFPTESMNLSLNSGETITSISLFGNASAALTSEGRLFTWGSNAQSQLGDGTKAQRSKPLDITSRFTLTSEEKIDFVSLGGNFGAALTSRGRIFTWGENEYGQLGDGTTISKNSPNEITANFEFFSDETLSSFALGGGHSAALTSSGRMFVWGANGFSQLGNGEKEYRNKPINITRFFS
jgi:alpha-tubulin suppressor-like RCC1 family protein